jgi:hypothetical protein
MTKEIRVTYVDGVMDKTKSTAKNPVWLVEPGQSKMTKGNVTQGFIAALEYKPGSDTQTTNPFLPFESGEVSQTRSFLRACKGLANAGSPNDIFELLIDGEVYRRTTRANLIRMYELCEQENEIKRAVAGLIERVAEIPAPKKGEKTESGEPGFVVM